MEQVSRLRITLICLFFAGLCFGGGYSGGTGEPRSPFRIATAVDLNSIGEDINDWDKHFVLVEDINLLGYEGEKFNIIGTSVDRFKGVLTATII